MNKEEFFAEFYWGLFVCVNVDGEGILYGKQDGSGDLCEGKMRGKICECLGVFEGFVSC